MEEEWGVPSSTDEVTTCVRRFGRPRNEEKRYRRDHITGSRMSNYNGHEVSKISSVLEDKLLKVE
jgi:WD repeat-containing protein 42A